MIIYRCERLFVLSQDSNSYTFKSKYNGINRVFSKHSNGAFFVSDIIRDNNLFLMHLIWKGGDFYCPSTIFVCTVIRLMCIFVEQSCKAKRRGLFSMSLKYFINNRQSLLSNACF